MKRILLLFITTFFIYFLSWFVLYKLNINTLPIQSEDTLPAMILPVSIIKDKTLYLDKYYKMLIQRYPHPDSKKEGRELVPFYLRRIEVETISCDNSEFCTKKEDMTDPLSTEKNLGFIQTHYVSAFPIITPLLAIPVYIIPVILGMPITWENLILLSHISSSFVVAISGIFFYKLLIENFFYEDFRKSLFVTGIYLFSTVNLSMVSQSMWQHGTLQLFVILGLYYLLEFLDHEKWYQIFLSGMFLSLAVLSRPTAALIYAFLFLLVFLKKGLDIKAISIASVFYFLGSLLILIFFMWYNNSFYQSITNQGYFDQLLVNWLGKFPESFFGIWISPSKGIIVYSPVLIFSLFGFVIALKQRYERLTEYLIFGLIVLFYTLVMSFWKHWYGGYSFGYRMSSDVIPFLVLLLIPFIKSIYYVKFKKLFFAALLISILVQISGLIFFDGIWHNAYDKGFVDTRWLWSLKDSEFAFNFRRIMVKLGLLDRACPQCLSS